MKSFEFIDDLTSDVMFQAYGENLEKLCENAAGALFSIICDISRIKEERQFDLELEEKDEEELLHAWLSILLTRSEIEECFFSRFEVEEIEHTAKGLFLKARVYGEPLTPGKGETVVKGITYYGFEVRKTEEGYTARVACDI